jgi:hypothetical protein
MNSCPVCYQNENDIKNMNHGNDVILGQAGIYKKTLRGIQKKIEKARNQKERAKNEGKKSEVCPHDSQSLDTGIDTSGQTWSITIY